MKTKLSIALIAVLSTVSFNTNAAILITEVAPWASGNSPYLTDWFELTNTGSSAVNIAGWQMDDNSNGSGKVNLTGISSIAAGESVIFTETPATASFLSTWFGTNVPVGLQIGNYVGAGVGLSTGGDAVNIYNSTGVLQAKVTFGASTTGLSFDNAAGINNSAISTLSSVGINGAFKAVNDATEIGSPGTIVSAIPEASTYGMMLAGLGMVGLIARRRRA